MPSSDPAMQGPRYWELPDHEVTEFSSKRTEYCFIPIVFNEGLRFIHQIEQMSKNASLADIIVADRRCADCEMDPEWLKQNGVRALLTTDAEGGATAIRMAFAYALKQGYKGVVLIDGNGKDGVGALPEFLRRLDEGFDFVQGSRFMPGGVEKNTPLLRRVGIKFVMTPLVWLGCGYVYSDATNGFRGYSSRLLRDPRIEPLRNCFVHFNVQYYLTVMAPKFGFRVVEIPVERVYPDDGTIPTKVVGFRRNFQALWEMALTICHYYNPKV